MQLKLSIIIVNWNGINFLPNCLRSIVQNPPSVDFEIVVVDNKSSDGSVEWMRSDEAVAMLSGINFRLIESGENLGFGRANNLAIDKTEGPYVFLLNPDTVVTQNAIDRLLETLESDEKIGAVAPKLLNEDRSLQPSAWGFPPTPLTILVDGLKLYKLIPKKTVGVWLYRSHWAYDERRAVPMFSGAAILAKREMINEAGAFDPGFFMYGEDLEWCVRINRCGWLTVFEPDSEITHLGGKSSDQLWGTDLRRMKDEESFVSFQRKTLSSTHFRLNLLARLAVLVTYYVSFKLKGKDVGLLKSIIRFQLRSLVKDI